MLLCPNHTQELQAAIGFPEYYAEAARYETQSRSVPPPAEEPPAAAAPVAAVAVAPVAASAATAANVAEARAWIAAWRSAQPAEPSTKSGGGDAAAASESQRRAAATTSTEDWAASLGGRCGCRMTRGVTYLQDDRLTASFLAGRKARRCICGGGALMKLAMSWMATEAARIASAQT
jgi:hypothetical protein